MLRAGTGLGVALGGGLAAAFNWRVGLMIAALPGLGVAWLVFRQREPRRGSAAMMAAIGAGSIQHTDDDEGPALFDRGFRQFVRDMISGPPQDMRTDRKSGG